MEEGYGSRVDVSCALSSFNDVEWLKLALIAQPYWTSQNRKSGPTYSVQGPKGIQNLLELAKDGLPSLLNDGYNIIAICRYYSDFMIGMDWVLNYPTAQEASIFSK